MNIDFHYGIVYVVARLAGMGPRDAETVAHACEYVDDATTPGILLFKDGQTFDRLASAHATFDYANCLDSDNRKVWAPFHFLPGNQGDTFEKQVVCRKNSEVAQAMVRRFLAAPRRPNALHRLGVLLHTYVDTWAHQGFSGTSSEGNAVHHLEGDDHPPHVWRERLESFVTQAINEVVGEAVHKVVLVGHGAALHFPDLPWASWKYRNGMGDEVVRENLADFVEAANAVYKVIRAYQAGDTDVAAQPDMAPEHVEAIRRVLETNRSHVSEERLEAVAEQLTGGGIPEIAEPLPRYIPKGPGSWKHRATGIEAEDDSGDRPVWSNAFEDSDYRKFHDAVKEHQMDITHDLLPSFGIRLA